MNYCAVIPLSLLLLLTAGYSSPQGMHCQGEVKTLPGHPIGMTSAVIVDNTVAFSVLMSKQRIESGLLHSADSSRYVPSAVTKEGYLAQRLSGNRFCIIDPQKTSTPFTSANNREWR